MLRVALLVGVLTITNAVGGISSRIGGGQPGPSKRITQQEGRAVVASAAKASKNPRDFLTRCQDGMLRLSKDFELRAVNVTSSSERAIDIWIVGPAQRMCMDAGEAIRKMDPIETVAWFDQITVVVDPLMMTAPKIEKVAVTRNGMAVAPIYTNLVTTPLKNLAGATFDGMSGDVGFPLGAFAPGATVVVIAIPTDGQNITKKLSAGDLQRLQ